MSSTLIQRPVIRKGPPPETYQGIYLGDFGSWLATEEAYQYIVNLAAKYADCAGEQDDVLCREITMAILEHRDCAPLDAWDFLDWIEATAQVVARTIHARPPHRRDLRRIDECQQSLTPAQRRKCKRLFEVSCLR